MNTHVILVNTNDEQIGLMPKMEAHQKGILHRAFSISCELKPVSKFIYKAELENGLIEHEYDHVFIGYCDDEPVINKNEANAWKWMDIDALKKDININPALYTAWLKLALDHLTNSLTMEEIKNGSLAIS
ncbi:MAG: NUDIX domain-containing protein [Bacteroidetes bacterium]|nr:NUDIX domain-containing protein [Bacteroidota bacterium]